MILYHGTKLSRLDSIEKYGLGGVKLFGYNYSDPMRVYLTTSLQDAKNYGKNNLGSSDDTVIVLEIDTKSIDISKLRDEKFMGIYTYTGIIKQFTVVKGV